jgi:hypothetical protein
VVHALYADGPLADPSTALVAGSCTDRFSFIQHQTGPAQKASLTGFSLWGANFGNSLMDARKDRSKANLHVIFQMEVLTGELA